MKNKKIVIAVDGPAGSGKSTVSKLVAKRYNLLYLDTGAMYRALTLKMISSGINGEDGAAIIRMASDTDVNLTVRPGEEIKVFLDGQDVSSQIRAPEVTQMVKYIARVPEVRERMVDVQRRIAKEKGAVVEGRDIGTVVLPEAPFKFYLDATEEERSRRRFKELKEKGVEVNLDEIRSDVRQRDASDMEREVAPLKKAEDAICIDTTGMSIEEVADKISSFIE